MEHFHPDPSVQAVVDKARADRNAALHAVAGSGLRAAVNGAKRVIIEIRALIERTTPSFAHRPGTH